MKIKNFIRKLLIKNYCLVPDFILKRFLYPRNIVIEPIAGCNIVCKSCPADSLKRPYGKMSFNNFKKIIDKLDFVKIIDLFWMGEPFLNPDIFKMIRYLKQKGIFCKISTNGTTLYKDFKEIVDSGLDRLIISFDGFSQKTFEEYRKGINFDNVVRGINLITNYKESFNSKTPEIWMRTLIFKHNESELKDIKRFGLIKKVDKHFFIKPIIDNWGGKKNPDAEKIKPTEIYQRPKYQLNYCQATSNIAITHDGKVLPCCHDNHADFSFGNILKLSFDEIYWANRNLRNLANKRALKICENCTILEDDLKYVNVELDM